MSLKRVSISDLAEIIEKNKIETTDIFDRLVLEKITAKWIDIVGPVLEKNVFPDSFSKRKLILASSHPAYKQEISFLNEKIIKDVNSFFNHPVLDRIIFSTSLTGFKQPLKKDKAQIKKVK